MIYYLIFDLFIRYLILGIISLVLFKFFEYWRMKIVIFIFSLVLGIKWVNVCKISGLVYDV